MCRNFYLLRSVCLALLIAWPLSEARAQGIQVICETSPLLPGCSGVYRVIGTPPANHVIKSAQFRWKQTGPGCVSDWSPYSSVAIPPNFSISYIENFVGDFEVEAKVTITDFSVNPPVDSILNVSCNVTVPPPTAIDLSAPAEVTITFSQQAKIPFPVKCQGQLVCKAGDEAKEDLTDVWRDVGGGVLVKQPDQIQVGDPQFLYVMGGYIFDTKFFSIGGGANVQAWWNGLQIGAVISKQTQQLFSVWIDKCGNKHGYPLTPKFSSEMSKAGPNSVKFTLTPINE